MIKHSQGTLAQDSGKAGDSLVAAHLIKSGITIYESYSAFQNSIIPKDKIVTITNATDEMTKSYIEVSKKYEKILIPKRAEHNLEQLSDNENDDFNDLWDDFRDTKKTLH
jgi:hypothetical protein